MMDSSFDIRILIAQLARRVGRLDDAQLTTIVNRLSADPHISAVEILSEVAQVDPLYCAALSELARLEAVSSDETIYQPGIDEPSAGESGAAGAADDTEVAGDNWATMYESHGASDPTGAAGGSSRSDAGGDRSQRFRKLREHAQGGLGQVFVALDDELNRQVALKQMLDRFAHQSDSRERFVLEAEVTGSLEHPGVVPVYGLGAYEGGDPYYAMRFIEGKSLEEAIQEFHQPPPKDAEDPADRSFQLRRLVTRVVAVCQAIAYAHSRGVIHRDIKPENIMLGRFGETLVVDWGLAYFIDVPEALSEQSIADQLTISKSASEKGKIVGTPAFMSPEQARGDALDGRSDVYALGATLFSLLSNSTAVATTKADGESRPLTDVLRATREGRIRAVEQVAPDTPRPLAAICNRALSAERDDRYDSPLALADDLERWLSDEPVSAYRENLWERSRRWARRHQTLSTSVAAVVLVSIVGLSAFSAVLGEKNAKLSSLASTLQAKNVELDATIGDLKIAEARATQEAKTAIAVTEFLNEDLLAQASPLDAPNPRLEVRTVLNRAADSMDEEFADQPRVKAKLLKTIGISYNYLGDYERSQQALEESLALQKQQPDAEQRELLSTEAALGSLWLMRGQYDDAERLLRATWTAQQSEFGDEDPDTLDTQTELADLLVWMGRVKEARTLVDAAVESNRKVRGANHEDTLHCEAVRLNCMLHDLQMDDARAYVEDLQQRAVETLGEDSYLALEIQSLQAQMWWNVQEVEKAAQLFNKALKLSQRLLGDEHPATLALRGDLAVLEAETGDVLKGLQECRSLHQKCLEIYGADHRETIVSATYLASALFELDRNDEAKQLLLDALERGEKVLGPKHPEIHYCRVSLAQVLGVEEDYEGALRILEPVLKRRDELRFGPALQALMCSAEIDIQRGEWDAAVATLLELVEKTRQIDPQGDSWLFEAESFLLEAYVAAGSYDEADEKLAAMMSRVDLPQTQKMLAKAMLADAYWEAEEDERAKELVDGLKEWAKTVRDPGRGELAAMYQFAHLVYYTGDDDDVDDAVALYARVLEGQLQQLGPRHFESMNTMSDLAYLFNELGQPDKAESIYRLVAQGQEEIFGVAHEYTLATLEDLATTLLDQDKHRLLIPILLKLREGKAGLSLDEDVATVDKLLGDSHRATRQYAPAIAAYQKYLDERGVEEAADDVDSLEAIAFMADCYSQQKQYETAAPWYRRVATGCRRLYGENADSTLRALSNLSRCLTRLPNKEAAAQALAELAAQIESRSLDAEEVLLSAKALAQCHVELQAYPEAVRWLRRVAEARAQIDGPAAPTTLATQQSLGEALTSMGREDESAKVFEELAKRSEAANGAGHAATRAAKIGWATAALHLEQLEMSSKVSTEVLDAIIADKGEASADTILPRTILAEAHMHAGQHPQAILQIRESLENAYRLLPEDRYDERVNESVATLLVLLAFCEAHDERFEDAWSHVSEAQELIEKTSLQYQWVEALGKLSLGVVHAGRKEHASGLTQLKAAYEELAEAKRISPTALKWHRRQAASAIADIYMQLNQPEDAEHWRRLGEQLK